jgi:hypothetical protein
MQPCLKNGPPPSAFAHLSMLKYLMTCRTWPLVDFLSFSFFYFSLLVILKAPPLPTRARHYFSSGGTPTFYLDPVWLPAPPPRASRLRLQPGVMQRGTLRASWERRRWWQRERMIGATEVQPWVVECKSSDNHQQTTWGARNQGDCAAISATTK